MTTNNTSKHIADDARYISFNSSNTRFPSSISTVQDALALTSPTTQATENSIGVAAIASLADISSGTDDTKIVTPLKLTQAMQRPQATETARGVAYIATQDDTNNGNDDTKIVTPLKLQNKINLEFNNRPARELSPGIIKLSTTTQAQAGTDDSTAITPLKLQQALASVQNSIISTDATESARGIVQLATVGQAYAGTIRNGYAISPYTLANMVGNSNSRGIVQAASASQANQGQDDTLYISAKGFQSYNGTKDFYGTVKLTDTYGTQGNGIVLSANANVLPTTGGTINGDLNVTGNLSKNGAAVLTSELLMPNIPIGSVIMWSTDGDPSGGKYMIMDGRQLNVSDYPELFSVVGYRYGGQGNQFNIPDARGLFMRMAGTGSAILNERGTDSKGKPKLGEGVNGGAVGEIQKQQLIRHKHQTYWGDAWAWNAQYGGGYTAQSGKFGSNKSDWDNVNTFTNDGTETESDKIRGPVNTLNPDGLIGSENRPWNMSINYIIKVK